MKSSIGLTRLTPMRTITPYVFAFVVLGVWESAHVCEDLDMTERRC